MTQEQVDGQLSTHLGLAGRVATQAIEGSGLHSWVNSGSGRAESRSSESERSGHVEQSNLIEEIRWKYGKGRKRQEKTVEGKGIKKKQGSRVLR